MEGRQIGQGCKGALAVCFRPLPLYAWWCIVLCQPGNLQVRGLKFCCGIRWVRGGCMTGPDGRGASPIISYFVGSCKVMLGPVTGAAGSSSRRLASPPGRVLIRPDLPGEHPLGRLIDDPSTWFICNTYCSVPSSRLSIHELQQLQGDSGQVENGSRIVRLVSVVTLMLLGSEPA